MAKYKARPFYSVRYGSGDIIFGSNGDYETQDAGEIRALDALCPRYLKKAEEPVKQAEADAKPKAEEAPEKSPKPTAEKPAAKRKANANVSAK